MGSVVHVANVEEKWWKSILGIFLAHAASNVEHVAELSEQRDELKEGGRRPAACMASEAVHQVNVGLLGQTTVDIVARRGEWVDNFASVILHIRPFLGGRNHVDVLDGSEILDQQEFHGVHNIGVREDVGASASKKELNNESVAGAVKNFGINAERLVLNLRLHVVVGSVESSVTVQCGCHTCTQAGDLVWDEADWSSDGFHLFRALNAHEFR